MKREETQEGSQAEVGKIVEFNEAAIKEHLSRSGHTLLLCSLHYNFCKIYSSIRCTPAMQAGITDHVWELSEVIAVLDEQYLKAA